MYDNQLTIEDVIDGANSSLWTLKSKELSECDRMIETYFLMSSITMMEILIEDDHNVPSVEKPWIAETVLDSCQYLLAETEYVTKVIPRVLISEFEDMYSITSKLDRDSSKEQIFKVLFRRLTCGLVYDYVDTRGYDFGPIFWAVLNCIDDALIAKIKECPVAKSDYANFVRDFRIPLTRLGGLEFFSEFRYEVLQQDRDLGAEDFSKRMQDQLEYEARRKRFKVIN